MEIQELEKELMQKNKWLYMKLEEQKSLIQKASESERNYRIALATKMLKLKAEGMQATLIPDVARGDKGVADLKFERDVAVGVVKHCISAIQSCQATMSGVQSLISTRRAEMKLL